MKFQLRLITATWLLTMTQSVFALSPDLSHTNHMPTDFSHYFSSAMTGMEEPMNLFGVVLPDWQKAACVKRSAPSLVEIETYLSNQGSDYKTAVVAGVQFVNENKKLLHAFGKLAGDKNLQTLYQINPHCANVQCAVEKVWGKEFGLKLLYLKMAHGFNASEFSDSATYRLSLNDLNQVLMSVGHLPGKFNDIGKDTKIISVNFQRTDVKAAADAVPNRIRLFEGWRRQDYRATGDAFDSYLKQYMLFHELGHLVGFNQSKGGLFRMLKASPHSSQEWVQIHQLPNCFISKYSKTNKREDFAETFASYRFNGWNLKQVCPEKYEFMKNNVYGGQEYLTEADCR